MQSKTDNFAGEPDERFSCGFHQAKVSSGQDWTPEKGWCTYTDHETKMAMGIRIAGIG
jgi:hypothetical protein